MNILETTVNAAKSQNKIVIFATWGKICVRWDAKVDFPLCRRGPKMA